MRYRFTSDDDGHDYIIPADKLDDWDEHLRAFYSANDKCEELPDQPEWAVEIDSYTCYSIGQWIKSFKPDAKTFDFDGYGEYNDEGGSHMCFSSLYIDGEDLEEIVKNLPKDKVLEYFVISNYYKKSFSELDSDEVWNSVRDNLDFDDCVYEYENSKQTIDA